MSVLLRPDGHLATKTMLAMSVRQVAWFLDPEALLRHLGDLKSVKIAAYCRHCFERGLPEEVTASFNPTTRAWTVRCACADYPLIHDKGRGGLVINKPKADGTIEAIRVRSVDELLFRLGWSFKCAGDCARLGMHDGVRGSNDPVARMLAVDCGCTERRYLELGAS